MTDLIDRKADERIDRLNDRLLGYAIDRAIETGPRLGGAYGKCQVFKSGRGLLLGIRPMLTLSRDGPLLFGR